MADTRRSLADILTLFADNTAGDISAQDARDMIVSMFAGGLEANAQTVTTADITGAVGQLYICTIAGLTANRNLTLPSATVGERVGVYIADGDDTYSLILKGAASQTINGGSAATEWSRVFLQGECVIFRCVASNTWIIDYDGRLPSSCKLSRPSSQGSITTGTDVLIALNNSVADVGSLGNTSTNRITVRRAGNYVAEGFFSIASMADTNRINFKLYKNGAALSTSLTAAQGVTGTGTMQGSFLVLSLAAADYIQLYGWHEKGSDGTTGTGVNSPTLALHEVF